jgi:peptidoglycan/xylan/chitin deacetylase (PgdA/CDA1 family)
MSYLKDAVFGTLVLVERLRSRPIQEILLYHSVGDSVPDALAASVFRWQMTRLKRKFDVVPLRDLRCCIAGAPHRSVAVVTFDDGALDSYTVVLPILEELGIKATFFVVTGSVGGTYRGTYFQTPAMSRQQLRELAGLGHEVAAHTETHPRLTEIPLHNAREEMVRSKKLLEDLTGVPVVSFAYPFGELNDELRDCAGEVGFSFAATIREGILTEGQFDWLTLPRVGIDQSTTMVQFMGKTSYALERYEKFRGRRKSAPGHRTESISRALPGTRGLRN